MPKLPPLKILPTPEELVQVLTPQDGVQIAGLLEDLQMEAAIKRQKAAELAHIPSDVRQKPRPFDNAPKYLEILEKQKSNKSK